MEIRDVVLISAFENMALFSLDLKGIRFIRILDIWKHEVCHVVRPDFISVFSLIRIRLID